MGVYEESTIRFTDTNRVELKMLSRKLSALELEFFNNKAEPINVNFENLERFRISMGCLLEEEEFMCDYGDQNSFKNRLNLVATSKELVECKINKLFRKTEILKLEANDMSCLEEILTHPPQNSFGNLKELGITNCAGLAYLFAVSVAKTLTVLEKLKISRCPILKSVVNGENSEAGVILFQKLKMLSLFDLPELESFCDPVNLMELPQLMELKLERLPNFTSIFPRNTINVSANHSIFNKEVMIPKLEKLSVFGMKNLKEIWPYEITSNGEEVSNFSRIRVIQAESCHSLENLFPSNPTRLLCHLEELGVAGCDSITTLFNIDDLDTIEHLSSKSSLRVIKVGKCLNFRAVWRIRNTENNYSGPTANFDLRAPKDIGVRGQQEIVSTSSEEISKVLFHMSIVEFPSYDITYNFPNLRTVEFKHIEGVEVLFEIETPSNRYPSLVTTQPPPLLPYLERLNLYEMNTLTHLWMCGNWNAFFIHKDQPQSSFQNLTTIRLIDCSNIKYLFSPLMVELLSNLKGITIRRCDRMERIVSNGDVEDEEMTKSTCVNTTTALFPRLDTLRISSVINLKHIGGGVAKGTTNVSNSQSKHSQVDIVSWSLCQYPREIVIFNASALSSVIPFYAAGRMQKLQILRIDRCKSLMEVFETKEIKHYDTSAFSSCPRPTIDTMHKIPNLKVLEIFGCDSLENIFTFSTLESLKNLEELKISFCKEMKEIVKKEVQEHSMTSCEGVVFLRLKSIKLVDLPKLVGFFLGRDIDFSWRSLEYVMIDLCPQMRVFTCGRSTAPMLKYIHTELGKHNLECGLNFYVTPMLHQAPSTSLDGISSLHTVLEAKPWSFQNLIECNFRKANKKIFPSKELQQLQELESIHAACIYGVEEVFEVALEVTNHESPIVVKFPKLREVDLKYLPKLMYIWKNNRCRILEFPNLTRLSISECKRLEHVFTCSMIGCVMQLQELNIAECENMKEIIKEEEDSDAKVSEIKFSYLKSLKLENLESLEGFCLGNENFTFPSLNTLEINKCPIIRVFTKGQSTTPEQTVVKTSFGSFNVAEDINSFIMTKRQQGFRFQRFRDLF